MGMEMRCFGKNRMPFYSLMGMARVLSNNRNIRAFRPAFGLSHYAARQTESCFAGFVVWCRACLLFDGAVGALLFLMFAVSRETANICLPIVGIQVKQKFVW